MESSSENLEKRFLYTGKEQRREAKENFEEKCERKTLGIHRSSKPRWCPELPSWDLWMAAAAKDGVVYPPVKGNVLNPAKPQVPIVQPMQPMQPQVYPNQPQIPSYGRPNPNVPPFGRPYVPNMPNMPNIPNNQFPFGRPNQPNLYPNPNPNQYMPYPQYPNAMNQYPQQFPTQYGPNRMNVG